jgi:hypothetical protein
LAFFFAHGRALRNKFRQDGAQWGAGTDAMHKTVENGGHLPTEAV